ncbi:hypothetical protein R1flu_014151 [Riccia fluitans]|uniref:ATP-dependent Zn protease n=1 Tax=Riccia fluitans TaxID=41844 RepID=A0ABD1YFL8_9MARC
MKHALCKPLVCSSHQLTSVGESVWHCREWIPRCSGTKPHQAQSILEMVKHDQAFRTPLCFGRSRQLGSTIREAVSGRVAKFVTRARKSGGRDWQDYDDEAYNPDMDLGTAVDILRVLNTKETGVSDALDFQSQTPSWLLDKPQRGDNLSTKVSYSDRQTKNIFRILDAAQATTDLGMVGRAYDYLQERGFVNSFGKFKSQASEGERVVTPTMMLETAGLEASKLSPKKWGLSGNSSIALVATFSFFSYLVNNEIDIRPVLVLVLGLGIADAILLGGTGVGQVLSLWPPYKRRVLVHEAGHVLVAYLLGCPIRGVILDAMQAMKMGIQGQAGTQFWDETLENELRQDKLTGASIDRYSIVLFAGIAAEALVYGEAEGGESDENLFKSVVSQLQPPWSPAKMSNQARWAVLRAFTLIKEHRDAHTAIVEALDRGASLGSLIRTIEETVS